jgi:hypothetical protein
MNKEVDINDRIYKLEKGDINPSLSNNELYNGVNHSITDQLRREVTVLKEIVLENCCDKEEVKEIVREVLEDRKTINKIVQGIVNSEYFLDEVFSAIGNKATTTEECSTVEKKEWLQVGDTIHFFNKDGDHDSFYIRNEQELGNATVKAINGVGFSTWEELDAVRDLRKHEAKCRFTMEDFEKVGDERLYIKWFVNDDFEAESAEYNYSALDLVDYRYLPTKELAQERAEILKRLAKIRGLI